MSLVLFGQNGCGKSHTLKKIERWVRAVAMSLPLVRGEEGMQIPSVCSVSWPEVVKWLQEREFGGFDELVQCSMLLIDDVGAEHDPSGYGREHLYLLLSRRERKWNLVTTNIPPLNWKTKLEARTASRLHRNALHVDLTAVPDFSEVAPGTSAPTVRNEAPLRP